MCPPALYCCVRLCLAISLDAASSSFDFEKQGGVISQARCLCSGSRLACLLLPVICLPLRFTCLQAGCLWSGSRPGCLPLPFICLPLLFICLPGWLLVVGFPARLSHFLPLTLTLTHTRTPSHTHSLTHSLFHSHAHSLTRTHSHTHSHSHSHSRSLTLTLTHSPPSSGLLWPPLPCNPLSPSSGRRKL